MPQPGAKVQPAHMTESQTTTHMSASSSGRPACAQARPHLCEHPVRSRRHADKHERRSRWPPCWRGRDGHLTLLGRNGRMGPRCLRLGRYEAQPTGRQGAQPRQACRRSRRRPIEHDRGSRRTSNRGHPRAGLRLRSAGYRGARHVMAGWSPHRQGGHQHAEPVDHPDESSPVIHRLARWSPDPGRQRLPRRARITSWTSRDSSDVSQGARVTLVNALGAESKMNPRTIQAQAHALQLALANVGPAMSSNQAGRRT